MGLWNGRFAKETDSALRRFSASIQYDRRLYRHDIRGTLAHVAMLVKAGIINPDEHQRIRAGLQEIQGQIEAGSFEFREDLEDVHMNIEAALIRNIGPAGAKVHSGRSRNDQIATDERLYLREEADSLAALLRGLQQALVDLAGANTAAIMPGFTHLQHAQPVLFAHHLLAYVEMFERDRGRLLNYLPLGAGALAGSTLPLDREFVARELEFTGVLQNSMDAVADRDYAIEFLACLAITAMHCSRLAEDVVLWAAPEFGFIELDDAFCTGSSLMPQKKNPDIAELTRGKTGRVYGSLIGLLTVMKGLPLAYNRDMQEDKEGLFDAIDTVTAVLSILAPMFASASVRTEKMRAAAADPALMATDLAEWLVGNGVPFRDAHHQVGAFVGWCRTRGLALNQASLEQMRESVPAAKPECLALFDAQASVSRRRTIGGTAPEEVEKQLARWRAALA